jgi:cell division protein FtsI (penicillin-binding protein 3)
MMSAASSAGLHQSTTDRHLRVQAKTRLLVLWAVLALCFSGVASRLVWWGCLPRPEEPASPASGGFAAAPATRANIVDCRGELLATSVRTASLYLAPELLLDPEEAITRLKGVFPDLDSDDLRARIRNGARFVWVKRHLTPERQYAVLKCGIPGALFRKDEKRICLQGSLVSHVLGMTSVDHHGLSGIEKHQEARLAQNQEPLALTIDLRVQQGVHRALVDAMGRFQATGAVGMVMDVTSGALLAMVSLPDYDPNQRTAPQDALFNKATAAVCEPGSVFKAMTLAMALEKGTASFNSRYDATQPLRLGRFRIPDYQAKNRWLTLPEVLVHSSNIGTSRMALAVGGEDQRAFLKKMGLLDPLRLEIPETGRPLVPARWSDITTATVSYGYGVSVTPLQFLAATAAMVNGGVLHTPTLLAEQAARPCSTRVLDPALSRKMRQLMRLVVLEGSGKRAEVPGYAVIGKTGTAHPSHQGGYNRGAVRTTFVGAFPAHKPAYAVLVMLEDPKASKSTYGFRTAGWNAAVAGGEVIRHVATTLAVPPVQNDAFDRALPWESVLGPGLVHAAHHPTPATGSPCHAAE